MKLIKPSYEILTPIDGLEVLKTIEKVARTCYKSEDKITDDSAEKMVKALISRGHEAMIEFFDITVKFICDRGVSHELVRHRLADFVQESTRYCNYSSEKFGGYLTYILPEWFTELKEGIYDSINHGEACNFNGRDLYVNDYAEKHWLCSMMDSEERYNKLIELGWQAQQARSVLSNSLKTEINVKMNLRSWRNFFRLRTAIAAHPQMRELIRPLLDELKNKIPVIFDDINY